MAICSVCGDQMERPWDLVCYGCYIASLLPPWYQDAERYAYDKIWGHINATRKPRTGNDLLDSDKKTFYEQLSPLKRPPRLR